MSIEDIHDRELQAVGKPRVWRRRRKIRWVTTAGGLPEGIDVSNREKMWEWFETHR